jgi:hypothetical protein
MVGGASGTAAAMIASATDLVPSPTSLKADI